MRMIRESPPPSRWGKTKSGIYFYLVHTGERTLRGERIYRLKFPEGVTSTAPWTLRRLNAHSIRWLKHKPACFKARK